MADNARMYWLHALTPLHIGSGRGVGYIDLPIMREKVTNWPLVPGSAVKGVLRDWHEQNATPNVIQAFGTGGDEHANSGSLVFTDARIVCLPVRSFYGTFAWCTSPMALKRLKRDMELAEMGQIGVSSPALKDDQCQVTENSVLAGQDRKVLLEDLDLAVLKREDSSWLTFIAGNLFAAGDEWQKEFKKRFAIISDNVFNFLCDTGTEVTARVRIEDEKKTVASGALWYEEALPTETILGGLVWCDRVFGDASTGTKTTASQLLDSYCKDELPLQIGGKATVGHGRVRCLFSNGGPRK